ncbi:PAS domain S-box protein [bacterium]|nr:PAS domain S-box protein [bacterium]
MHFSPQKNSELASLIFILIIAIIFIALSMYIDLMYKINVLYNLLKVYAKVPIADFLFNIVFLIISITILILYIRWNEVKKRNRELENIIDSITPDVFIVVDSTGKIQLCSSSIENTFGFKREEVLDKNIDNLISNGVGISSQYDELYNRFREKGFHIGIGTGICKDDRQIPVEIVRAELKFSGGSVLLVRDISERKLLEEELTRYRETLEEMVAESTAELRKANEQLKSEIASRIRLEMQLRRERDFNKMIIETAPVFFVAINPNGKTIMMNKTMLDALGYKEDEVIGTD